MKEVNACFSYYVLHFVPVTIIRFYTIQLNLPVWVKFCIITILSLLKLPIQLGPILA